MPPHDAFAGRRQQHLAGVAAVRRRREELRRLLAPARFERHRELDRGVVLDLEREAEDRRLVDGHRYLEGLVARHDVALDGGLLLRHSCELRRRTTGVATKSRKKFWRPAREVDSRSTSAASRVHADKIGGARAHARMGQIPRLSSLRRLLAAPGLATFAYSARRHFCARAEEQQGFKVPPPEIASLADAKPVPAVSVQPRTNSKVLHMEYSTMLSLEDMSAPVLRLAGIRFNPFTLLKHGPHSPELYYTALALQDVKSGEKHDIPLPENARINHISWSPDGSRVAFTVRTAEIGADAVPKIHILDASTGSVTKPAAGEHRPRRAIHVAAAPSSSSARLARAPTRRAATPCRRRRRCREAGGGQKAAVRTYPNLLTSAEDAAAFRHYATVQLVEVSVTGGERLIGPPCLNYHATSSPDGSTLLTHSLRPDHLSYAVPWSRFGRKVELLPLAPDGAAATLQVAPVVEAMPIGHDACRAGPRQYAWRPDQPAMITYVEALDGGDPKVKPAEGKRDKVMLLSAPYTCPHELCRTATRYQHARWTAGGTAVSGAVEQGARRSSQGGARRCDGAADDLRLF